MVELPERLAQARQANECLRGKAIVDAEANHTPHGFAGYSGDPATYPQRLVGKTVQGARYAHGELCMQVDDLDLLITTPMRYHPPGAKTPAKHQLWLAFADGSQLTCSVAMWGSMLLLPRNAPAEEAPDWLRDAIRREIVTPLDEAFTLAHFKALMPPAGKAISVKGLLATEQRIPGIGNGVIQDILFTAELLPMHDARTLTEAQWQRLYDATKDIVRQMAEAGGRDTEKDLHGKPGGYHTILSRKTANRPCPRCGHAIERKAFLGGNVYFCPQCQT